MDKSKLKQLLLNELSFREKFKAKRKELEDMVHPITNHVVECCNWWEINIPKAEEIIVTMDNGTTLKLVKPKMEMCSVESYLPYGVDFTECELLSFSSSPQKE